MAGDTIKEKIERFKELIKKLLRRKG